MFEFNLYMALGIFIVVSTAADFFYTTLSFNGAGYINKTLTAVLSSIFIWLNKQTRTRFILKFSGLCHILVSMFLWIGLLWFGLFFILSSTEDAVIHSVSQSPADLLNIFYFSGYVLSTLGNGEFIPSNQYWQVTVAIFSFSGFIFITTGISYLLNLGSAILHKKSLALFISQLGNSPEEIISNMYDKGNFEVLRKRIPLLQEKINKHSQNHLAYPIAHYFYSTMRSESLAVNLANLDEALSVIQFFIEKDTSTEKDIRTVRNAINKFLLTIQHSFITQLENYEDLSPNVRSLKELDIPVADKPVIENRESFLEKRRSLLAGLLRSSGWTWKDVYGE